MDTSESVGVFSGTCTSKLLSTIGGSSTLVSGPGKPSAGVGSGVGLVGEKVQAGRSKSKIIHSTREKDENGRATR